MKAKLQKRIGTVVMGLALGLHTLPAWAGNVSLSQVVVESTYATGSMGGARYSSDSQQYIGCSISNTNGSAVVCSAMDKAGRVFTCVSTEAKWVAAAKAITDSSALFFGAVSGTPACGYLRVANYSSLLK
jgi:hypothetical protein